MNTAVGILGVGHYLPDQVLTNHELASSLGVTEAWIADKTGVLERRVAAPDEATSDLAAHAGLRALTAAGITAADLDLIVVATSSGDWIQPSTACAVQGKLGAVKAAAYDLGAVCTGFVYALSVVAATMRGDPALRHALVIGAETYSRILDYQDRKTCVLFGDGAGAVVLGRVPAGYGILGSCLGADGTKTDLVAVPAGGSRKPASAETVAAREHYFRMDGRAVRAFLKDKFPEIINMSLAASGLSTADIDLIIPHQANGVLLNECVLDLGLDPQKVHYTVDRYGNTGGASVPITLADAVARGRIEDGDHLLLVALGGGMTWGGVFLRWGRGSAGARRVVGAERPLAMARS